VDDYSEFPTTPTAWQEQQEKAWQEVGPLETEDPPPAPRRVDLTALVPGVIFSVLAIALMSGLDIPLAVFGDGGILWVLLIGAGVTVLVRELRRSRRKQ
jgi:hypothetical protein